MKVFHLIKNTFHAHEDNKWRPYLLRLPLLLLIIIVLASVNLNINPGKGRVLGAKNSTEAAELIELINNKRIAGGLLPFTVNGSLAQAAEAKAEDMLARDYWSHHGPDGEPPWIFLEQQNYSYRLAGENLAKGFYTNQGVLSGWLGSSAHRDNLLSNRFIEIGVAVVEGVLEGEHSTLVVAFFGLPQGVGLVLPATDIEGNFGFAASGLRFSITNPLPPLETLSTAAKATVVIFALITLTYLNQHLVIRRHKLKWDWHPHKHPLVMATAFSGAALLIIIASFGSVL